VAVEGLRVVGNPSNLDALLSRYKVGDTVGVHAFRRDELMTFSVQLQGDRVPDVKLTLVDERKKVAGPARPSAGR
jgi:predicted metalloprotease with PDZ domain